MSTSSDLPLYGLVLYQERVVLSAEYMREQTLAPQHEAIRRAKRALNRAITDDDHRRVGRIVIIREDDPSLMMTTYTVSCLAEEAPGDDVHRERVLS